MPDDPTHDVPFPTSSSPGLKPQEGGGRLINAFVEHAPAGAPGDILYKRSPGLRQVYAQSGNVHTRGFLDCSTSLLWIVQDGVDNVTFDGTNVVPTFVGTLSGNTPVTVARNNAGTPQNVGVTPDGVFNLFTGGAPTSFADPDLPVNPTSVCDLDGYFVWGYPNGSIYASDLNSVNVQALSFDVEQGLFVRRVVRYTRRLFVFGDKWTGVWRNVGTSPFPFGREATIPRGIAGTFSVAGWETGWSNELLWAGDDGIVYKLNGYTPVPISNDDVSRDIQTAILAGDGGLLQASVYMYGKHAMWTLTYPDFWTWEFNLTTGEWNERQSYVRDDWRGRQSVRMFSQWLIGDDLTGKLFRIDGVWKKEADDPLIWTVISGNLTSFPFGVVISKVVFAMTTGVGEVESVLEPKVVVSWSLDGGFSYKHPAQRNLRGPGETQQSIVVRNLGLSRGQGIRFK